MPPIKRNNALYDIWSLLHLITGIVFGWIMDPFIALLIMVLWEPLEVLVLSPLLKKHFNIIFGYESIRNSLSDIFFDAIGVLIGTYALTPFIVSPIHFF